MSKMTNDSSIAPVIDAPVSLLDFCSSQRKLLDLELKSEQEEEERENNNNNNNKGGEETSRVNTLHNLECVNVSVGLYGRTVVTLELRAAASGTPTNNDAKTTNESGVPLLRLLPSHRLTVGDEIEIHSRSSSSNKKRSVVGGVICAVLETSLTVALFSKNNTNTRNNVEEEEEHEKDGPVGAPPLMVLPKSSVEVHLKLVKTLGDLETYGVDHPLAGNIVRAAFGCPTEHRRQIVTPLRPVPMQPFNANLDASQLEAIEFALQEDRPLALIHGPPGTGKTTTLAELIHQAVHIHNMKVLVTAPSNVAVDNILERLVLPPSIHTNHSHATATTTLGGAHASKRPATNHACKKQAARAAAHHIRAVRLGHPARIKPSIVNYSLESLVQHADGTEIVADIRRELQSFLNIASHPKSRGADKRAAYREIKSLRREIRTREEKVVQELIVNAQVVLATNVGAANRILDKTTTKDNRYSGFDLVIIDEAAQALEASCWIPILRGKRLVLAGDHCQLPPTIKCKSKAVQKALGKTLFERIMELYKDSSTGKGEPNGVSRMLRVQYRMHQNIADWASTAMYRGELQTDVGVKDRTLSQLHHVRDQSTTRERSDEVNFMSETTLLLIDTSGCDMHETVNSAGSRFNDGEAQIVSSHVRTLLKVGLRPDEIAVISPYNGQVELLRTMLLPDFPTLEIRSVDGFQGGEREAVVLSLVRSSDRGGWNGIGFLKDDRRLNVAVTRAKRHCAVICASETVSQSPFIKGLLSWIEERGDHRSAIEYIASDSEGIEVDFQDAEAELLRLLPDLAIDERVGQPGRATLPIEENGISLSENTTKKCRERNKQDLERRKAMFDNIAAFAETGSKGDELSFSAELSKFDQKVIHEFAMQLGLDSRSDGVDGINRRIIVKIKKKSNALKPEQQYKVARDNSTGVDGNEKSRKVIFTTLDMGEEDSTEDEEEKGTQRSEFKGSATKPATTEASGNQLLAILAQERMQRQRQLAEKPAATQMAPVEKKKKKKKTARKKSGKTQAAEEDELDDMAFLDAQVEKVQTSHGRKVEAKGSGYRSIMNGILIGKPPVWEEKKDARASTALQEKLKKAQSDRKGQKGNKKKKSN